MEYDVSVIVPVYNSEKYLDQCLTSLINQTLKSIEIIIINDGSTDKSLKIIDRYNSNYDNVKVYNQTNHGLFYSRKQGLKHATGEYVGWVDSDDFVDSSMFEILYNTAKKNNSDLVYCNYKFYPQKIKTKEKWFHEYVGEKNVDFVERNSQPWNKLAKKDLLDRLKIGDLFEKCFDEAYIKVLLNAKNPISVDKKLYFYRVGNSTMSSSYKNVEHYLNFIQSSKNLKVAMSDLCNSSPYWNEYFNFRILYYDLLTMIVAANACDKDTYTRLKEQKLKFSKNKHFKYIMKQNYGSLKTFIMGSIIPLNYNCAHFLCRLAFK